MNVTSEISLCVKIFDWFLTRNKEEKLIAGTDLSGIVFNTFDISLDLSCDLLDQMFIKRIERLVFIKQCCESVPFIGPKEKISIN